MFSIHGKVYVVVLNQTTVKEDKIIDHFAVHELRKGILTLKIATQYLLLGSLVDLAC